VSGTGGRDHVGRPVGARDARAGVLERLQGQPAAEAELEDTVTRPDGEALDRLRVHLAVAAVHQARDQPSAAAGRMGELLREAIAEAHGSADATSGAR
jgi:hypothetical protein